MKSLQNRIPNSSEEFEYEGSVIVSAKHIFKMEVDDELNRKLDERVLQKYKRRDNQ